MRNSIQFDTKDLFMVSYIVNKGWLYNGYVWIHRKFTSKYADLEDCYYHCLSEEDYQTLTSE